MKKYLILLLTVVLVVSVMFGGISCKEEVAEDTTEEVAEDTTEEVTEDTTEEVAEEKDVSIYKLASYWPAVHPYYESVKKGLAKHFEDFGIEIHSQIGIDWTQPTENEQVEALVAQGYNGLMVFPLDAAGANALYEEVVEQGIPVINYGAPTIVPTPASFTLATNVKEAAKIAAEKVCEEMDYKGGILNVLEVVTDPNTILRKEGVEEVAAKYPDVEIVQTIGDMLSIEECTEKISNALAAKKDEINGIVTTGYNPTVATANILTELENDSIAFVGIDDDPIVLKAIELGYITGTFGQNPYCQGYAGPVFLELLIDGAETKQEYVFVDTSGVVITKENIDTFLDELWNAAFELAANAEELYFK